MYWYFSFVRFIFWEPSTSEYCHQRECQAVKIQGKAEDVWSVQCNNILVYSVNWSRTSSSCNLFLSLTNLSLSNSQIALFIQSNKWVMQVLKWGFHPYILTMHKPSQNNIIFIPGIFQTTSAWITIFFTKR